MSLQELRFTATPEKGEVSALFMRPDHATHLLVMAHGAGADMRHLHLATIAERLSETNIASLRFNFPYIEHGGRIDAKAVCVATVRAAVRTAQNLAPDLPVLAGGHSFGGRMTSTAAAESPLDGVLGLVLFSFPLHPPGRPDTSRAEHLTAVRVPMLFLNGTRDPLADESLLRTVCGTLPLATLHFLETADHGFRVLKRTRRNTQDVYVEAANAVRSWLHTMA